MNPTALASYWINYVIRYGGAPHLKSPGQDMNFFAYHNLDVGIVLASIVCTICFIFIKIIMILSIKYPLTYWPILLSKLQRREIRNEEIVEVEPVEETQKKPLKPPTRSIENWQHSTHRKEFALTGARRRKKRYE